MRIVYGVHGYGRGHATRALAVLGELSRRHELLILGGGEAYASIWPDFPIVRIPTLGYFYAPQGRRSNWLTFRRNFSAVADLLLRGPAFQQVVEQVRDFRPDVVISDAEPWTHRAARRLRIPRIGFDHFGIMAYCRPPMPWADRLLSLRDVFVYRRLMGRPERVIVSSFYDAPPRYPGVKVIGPLLRSAVLQTPARSGNYLLAYFNNGEHQLTPSVEAALRAAPLRTLVYGTPRRGADGNLDFRPPSNLPFLEDLAGCRGVISTAGNQLVGEALHFGKPMLVMPEDCVEQRLNGAAVERMGIGMQTTFRRFRVEHIQRFLAGEAEYHAAIARCRRDGRREAIEAIEQFLDELAGRSGAPSDRMVSAA